MLISAGPFSFMQPANRGPPGGGWLLVWAPQALANRHIFKKIHPRETLGTLLWDSGLGGLGFQIRVTLARSRVEFWDWEHGFWFDSDSLKWKSTGDVQLLWNGGRSGLL